MTQYKNENFKIDTNALMRALQDEKKKVIDNINDIRSDPKKARHIVIDVAFEPDPNNRDVKITSTIVSKLAPYSCSALSHGIEQLSVDDIEDPETGEIR